MRSWFFLAFFASGLAIVSWQLFGEEGSHARLAMLETALAEQNRVNESLRLRNEELAAEVFRSKTARRRSRSRQGATST